VVREGGDVTIVTLGRMVHTSLAAAEELAGGGVQCEVIDLRRGRGDHRPGGLRLVGVKRRRL